MPAPTHGVSRRDFIVSAVCATAALAVVPVVHLGRSHRRTACCGAEIIRPSRPLGMPGGRGYCPNCGVSFDTQRFHIRHEGWVLTPAKTGTASTPTGWNPIQVPFPHPDLVRVTSKPIVSLKAVRV